MFFVEFFKGGSASFFLCEREKKYFYCVSSLRD